MSAPSQFISLCCVLKPFEVSWDIGSGDEMRKEKRRPQRSADPRSTSKVCQTSLHSCRIEGGGMRKVRKARRGISNQTASAFTHLWGLSDHIQCSFSRPHWSTQCILSLVQDHAHLKVKATLLSWFPSLVLGNPLLFHKYLAGFFVYLVT